MFCLAVKQVRLTFFQCPCETQAPCSAVGSSGYPSRAAFLFQLGRTRRKPCFKLQRGWCWESKFSGQGACSTSFCPPQRMCSLQSWSFTACSEASTSAGSTSPSRLPLPGLQGACALRRFWGGRRTGGRRRLPRAHPSFARCRPATRAPSQG